MEIKIKTSSYTFLLIMCYFSSLSWVIYKRIWKISCNNHCQQQFLINSEKSPRTEANILKSLLETYLMFTANNRYLEYPLRRNSDTLKYIDIANAYCNNVTLG